MSQPPSAPPSAGPSNLACLRISRHAAVSSSFARLSKPPLTRQRWPVDRHLDELIAAQIDAPRDLEIVTFVEAAYEVLMPFAMVEWLLTWPAFVADLATTVHNLAPGIMLWDAMVDVVSVTPVAPALPAVPVASALPAVLVSPANPLLHPWFLLPFPGLLPWDTRPESSDMDHASRPVCALPVRASPHRLTPSPDAAPAAPSAPVSSSTWFPLVCPLRSSASVSPVSALSIAEIEPPALWRQACRIPKGSNPSAKDLQCKQCIYYKEKCKWTLPSATGSKVSVSVFGCLSERHGRLEDCSGAPTRRPPLKRFSDQLSDRALYAYRELCASYDAAIIQAGLAAKRLMARDALRYKLWDHYLHLTGLHALSDSSLLRSSSKGKEHALSISSDDEEQDMNDNDGDNDNNHWPRIGSSKDNDRDAGAGGSNVGASAQSMFPL
ncbi:hypothetical protein BGY98DRAFT_1099542 [Russula aff. rugulosa BPL654]|nr:hypothetical protein BGY98DRAFT_1099542 [Russula aff. rugulosa BPL654]